jgi:hypothetical protein
MWAFVIAGVLVFGCRAFSSDQPVAAPGAALKCDIIVPDEWKNMISAGPLTVHVPPFYGVAHSFGLSPVVRCQWPVRNLTSELLYLRVHFRSDSHTEEVAHTGMDICYALAPGETRQIDSLSTIISAAKPATFVLYFYEPRKDGTPNSRMPSRPVAKLEIAPQGPPDVSDPQMHIMPVNSDHFAVEEIRLAAQHGAGNTMLIKLRNKTTAERRAGILVAVNDPAEWENAELGRERGTFSQAVWTIPAMSETTVRATFEVTGIDQKPLLVFTLFEPRSDLAGVPADDVRHRDFTMISLGWADLLQAARRGECVIPPFVPVAERANLTEESKSEHFVYRYRPGSYAEKHLASLTQECEQAYNRLARTFRMELPRAVQIDLYPDMKAKAFGSKTSWTPMNTVNDFQIAEVYNQAFNSQPWYELPHCFSYRFPGHPDLGSEGEFQAGGGMIGAIADYFRTESFEKSGVRRQLEEGKLPNLSALLRANDSSAAHEALVDFLIRKDVEKFKQFYVRVIMLPKDADPRLQAAAHEVYGMSLEDLEREWHTCLKNDK